MFLFLLGKHDCLFGMVGLWWCWIQLSLPGEYGVVRAQYYRICLGVLVLYSAWILYLLVLTRITKIGHFFSRKAWKLEVPSVYNKNTDIYGH